MTVRLSADGAIELDGSCGSEEAETLLQYLLATPAAHVDWRCCTYAHTAIVQILLAARPVLRGPPASDFLRTHLDPALYHGQ
jgi:hypothetical protein